MFSVYAERIDSLRQSRSSLGDYQERVDACLAELQRRDAVGRTWRGDHTVWKPDPAEITDRLGWLTVTDAMRESVADLEDFARQVHGDGIRHVVLLGMGGSSLGPEVLRQTFGTPAFAGETAGFPELIVLDSTIPARVKSVTNAIDPARTLFLVSSKSGTTIEPNVLYRYFRRVVEERVGVARAGRTFAAVTDEGTPLAELGASDGFRRVFVNPSDIGGRYSVLSYFGLVPAALIGLDVGAILDRADGMREAASPGNTGGRTLRGRDGQAPGYRAVSPVAENPGAWLGAVLGCMAEAGRDKVTLAASPSVRSFGLWVEQLLAESTGKEGKGIIPIAGEPLAPPECYGDDRLFVYLRLEGDDNCATDAAMDAIEESGQPVVSLRLRDRYGLFAEMYRWEFATAVAGAVLGIHPFNQPDVQSAKDMTDRVLGRVQATGKRPVVEASGSLGGLLAQASPGDYLAVMAYVRETPETDAALDDLRLEVMGQYGIATTVGYGPRFLHSTGQLHKGGPASGLLLQITAEHAHDLDIPGREYTFGGLADAQAMGDFEALAARGLRMARAHLTGDVEAGIQGLIGQLQ